jgi:hypothetical protein
MPASPARKLTLVLAGIVAGAAILTPGVGIAAKFLTKGSASKIFVSKMSAERGRSGDAGGTTTTPVFLDVKITAPTDGFLMIQGSARVDNQTDRDNDEATLTYNVDDKPGVQAARATLGADKKADQNEPGETAQLSYVDVVAVTKGSHSVRQFINAINTDAVPPGTVGGGGGLVHFENASLVVTFFPGKGATVG